MITQADILELNRQALAQELEQQNRRIVASFRAKAADLEAAFARNSGGDFRSELQGILSWCAQYTRELDLQQAEIAKHDFALQHVAGGQASKK